MIMLEWCRTAGHITHNEDSIKYRQMFNGGDTTIEIVYSPIDTKLLSLLVILCILVPQFNVV